MKHLWQATEGIRFLGLCFLIMACGMVWMVGCGGSDSSGEVEETQVSFEEWEAEEAEEGYYYGREAAREANKLCEDDQGVLQVVMNEENYGLELVVCEDGEAEAP